MHDAWRTIPKTSEMLRTEEDYGGTDIRDVILSELRKADYDQDAAKLIGITPSVLSRWIRVLSIYDDASTIWDERKQEKVG